MRKRVLRLAPDAKLPVPTIGLAITGGGGASPAIQVDGTLAVSTDVGSYIASGISRINAVYIRCETPGTAGTTIVDIHLNGVTVFTVQGNRPMLAWNDPDGVAKSGVPDITTLAENDVLTVEIDQVATGAEDLVVVIDLDLVVGLVGPAGAAGGADLAFAEIYAVAANDTIVIGAAGKANRVQVTSFDTNGLSNNMTPDHTNDHITVVQAGEYLCVVSLHVETVGGGDADLFAFSVYRDNGTVEYVNVHAHRQMAGGGGDVGSIGLSGLIDLAAGETIELWCWNEDDNENIVIQDVTFSLAMTGAGIFGAPHDFLDGAVHPDTVAQAPTRGSIIVGTVTPKWDELLKGAAGTVLTAGALDISWAVVPAHKDRHKLGGGDAFLAADLVDAVIRRLRETGGPTDMLLGAIANGEYLKRVGATIVGGTPAAGAGLYSDYIHITDEKVSGVDGGGFTLGAWRTRDLNTERADTGNHATVAANQITLQAGTYRALISCPAIKVLQHKARLQNITDGVTLLVGTSEYSRDVDWYAVTRSFIMGRFTLAAAKVLEVQHRSTATQAANGFGVQSGFGVNEIYTVVELWKEA